MRKLINYFSSGLLLIVLLILNSCQSDNQISFETSSLVLNLDRKGNIEQLIDKKSKADYLAANQPSPFLSIRIDGEIIKPSSLEYKTELSELVFKYKPTNVRINVKVETKSSHLAFELFDIQPIEKVELVIWGPYPTTISKSIGETVGVVRGEEFALGLQALNPKTLGGYPWNENDCMPQLDIFENDDFSDLNEEGKRYVLYRVEAAKPEDFGSTLQAYCRNRNRDRIIENWNHEKYNAPAYDDGGVVGSKIALFGCAVDQTLDCIEKIEIAEKLPHPTIDGEWGKKSRTANSSYLIMSFGEEDIKKAIDYTKKAGFKYLYHSGPFKTWGHFQLNDQFPNGVEGFKNCVERAEKEGIHVGVHTLSNFITTNDSYVTPIPDNRLAKVGLCKVLSDVNKTITEIEIESPEVFSQTKNNNLKTVVIDDELIRYGSVSESKPWKLLDCQRGAYGTKSANHIKGVQIALLADHGYKVFLTDAELTKEIAINIANLYNQTGLRQISFDGLEGNRSTGMGNYGEILMTTAWFDNLDDNIKSHLIVDASRTSHYFWHIYSRMNWGEPWYAGFRESQTEYRFKNQKYFERNLMPGMLGWFLMTDQTSLEDIEWMLAKASGYNAGFGFVGSYNAFEGNGFTEEILEQIKIWEQVRLAGAFNEEIREKLRNLEKEFSLKEIANNQFELREIHSFKVEHTKKERQPGEPVFSKLEFNNQFESQNMEFILTVINGAVRNIKLEVDNYKEITIPQTINDGETLKFLNGSTALIYDINWKKINEINMDAVILSAGEHTLTLNCTFEGKETRLKLEIRIPDEKAQVIEIL